jgi:hypothetical protein
MGELTGDEASEPMALTYLEYVVIAVVVIAGILSAITSHV